MVALPRVLLIDDEPYVRMTLAANLELAGFEVVATESVAGAIAALERSAFDCVVSDVRMPGEDGVSGLDKLRMVQPDIPAIFVTGYDAESVIPAALAKGAFTVLPKPVSVKTLARVLRTCLTQPLVLVVDDEPSFLEMLVEALREGGLKAERASRREEAAALVESRSVDVCILDLVLDGDVSGGELLGELRRLSPGLSVIAMTGHDVGDHVRDALKNGALHCLKKPFEWNALARLIARVRAEGPALQAAKPFA
ncbi:MAG: response regulator [Polyangiaceae bacterium]